MREVSLFTPRGLDDPVVCNKAKWVTTRADTTKGIIK